ncbi:hypothetical protein EVAR_21733_1 [Eumeta japonica]|uniref:Mos1 transposase HTH domain-containing protein n=1 Tax=Eumeta variegata TaxID=151549 RepID=A0A4C1W8X4_EUMVA|nr:hypothetical protein EVAR_21733_1 [Eumeta japonica]
MDLSRENFRSMIFYNFKCKQLSRSSLGAFGNEAPCDTIYNCFAKFKRGRVNPSDEFNIGRSSTVVNDKNIDSVRRIIETDRHVTCYQIRKRRQIWCGT